MAHPETELDKSGVGLRRGAPGDRILEIRCRAALGRTRCRAAPGRTRDRRGWKSGVGLRQAHQETEEGKSGVGLRRGRAPRTKSEN
ncbi:hypothetical protein CDAR_78501 [Caerostris darwini]|uniref:Uncharacterized protein n=1 Tax=Caerostris darwini TaxID=1538125 RepID=A0AAV4R762_9ARAC|nr:hypothetical protein CDAR_78501 [Caerostris darwini]